MSLMIDFLIKNAWFIFCSFTIIYQKLHFDLIIDERLTKSW